jgi:hypothetical protein
MSDLTDEERAWALMQALTEEQKMFVYMSPQFREGMEDIDGVEHAHRIICELYANDHVVDVNKFEIAYRAFREYELSSVQISGAMILMMGTYYSRNIKVHRTYASVQGILTQMETEGRVAIFPDYRSASTWIGCECEDDLVMLQLALSS